VWTSPSWKTHAAASEPTPLGKLEEGRGRPIHSQMFSCQVAFTLRDRDGNGNSRESGKIEGLGGYIAPILLVLQSHHHPRQPTFQIIILNAAICHLWGFATCPLWLECVVCLPSLSLDSAPSLSLAVCVWACAEFWPRVFGKQIVKSSPGKYF